MTSMACADPEQRGALAVAMLPVAAELAAAVHGDGGPEDVAQLLDALANHEVRALLVVLAGLVEVDRPLGALLGWLDFDEHGRPIEPDTDERSTLQQIADQRLADRCRGDIPDQVAIDRALTGEPLALTSAERLELIATAHRAGRPWAEIDALLGHKPGSGAAYRAWLRARRAAHARGRGTPNLPAPQERLSAEQVADIRERAQTTPLPALATEQGMQLEALRRLVQGKTYRSAGGPLQSPTGCRALAATAA